MLSSIPFVIRSPSLALVEKFSQIAQEEGSDDITLALAHFVEKTCSNAGYLVDENIDSCTQNLSDVWAEKYFVKFQEATSKREKMLAVGFLANLKSTRAMELLTPLASGDMTQPSECSLQAASIRASFWGSVRSKTTTELFLPIFLNLTNCREARLAALDQLFIPNNIDVTSISMIMTQMFAETDIQIINYVFTLFEKHSKSSYICNADKAKRVGYFLKYMKQLRLHKVEYDLSKSQTYRHEYFNRKYAFGGGHEVWIVGGGDSFVPAEMRFKLDSKRFGGYQSNILEIRLRTQGLAEAFSKVFDKRDKDTWKTKDLEKVFLKMGILLKQSSPVEVDIEVKLQDVIVFQRHLTKDILSKPNRGAMSAFVNQFQDNQGGESNVIHWARMLNLGSQVY